MPFWGWELSWIAVVDEKIVGVVLTSGEWLDDLWVLRETRDRAHTGEFRGDNGVKKLEVSLKAHHPGLTEEEVRYVRQLTCNK